MEIIWHHCLWVGERDKNPKDLYTILFHKKQHIGIFFNSKLYLFTSGLLFSKSIDSDKTLYFVFPKCVVFHSFINGTKKGKQTFGSRWLLKLKLFIKIVKYNDYIVLTFWKPMSLAYCRKHWRHMFMPYFRINPCLFEQTRLEQEKINFSLYCSF